MRELAEGILIVGGVRSNEYGIYVLDVNDADMPARSYETYSIPGRSRDIHYDNGRYENVERVYKLYIADRWHTSAESLLTAFLSRLMRLQGYQRIEDTLHPEYVKYGEFKGSVTPAWAKRKDAARVDIAFDCDARKYLRMGEEERTLSIATQTIYNPGTEDAAPVFTVTGNGYINIGSNRITIANNTETMVIDTEIGDAYSQSTHGNLNNKITVTGEFPVLAPGNNSVKVSGLTSCTMVPRWRSL